MCEKKSLTSAEWKSRALGYGKKGATYWWSNVDRKRVRETRYILEDGTVVGVPESDDYGVEIRHPDGTYEYPH